MNKLNRRILYVTKAVTPERALEIWKADVMTRLEDVKDALNAPLPTEESVYTEVKPGEPGYDDASYEIAYDPHPMTFKTPIK